MSTEERTAELEVEPNTREALTSDSDNVPVPQRYEPANRQHLTLLDRAIMLLENDVEHRREEDIVPLLAWWRKRSDVFKRLRNETLINLVKYCALRPYEEHEIILRQGETGDCCYLILTGKVSVYINYRKKDQEEAAKKLARNSAKNSAKNSARNSAKSEKAASAEAPDTQLAGGGPGDAAQEGDGEAELQTVRVRKMTALPTVGRFCPQRKLLGTYVVTLGTGAPFGEMALLSQDRVRKAYVVADERVYLMVITQELFDGTIKSVMEDDYKDKRTLINNYQLFAGWRPDYKEQLAMAFERFVFSFGEAIVNQGDPLDSIYFIVSGEVNVEVNVSQHDADLPATMRECRDRLDAVSDEIYAIRERLMHRFGHSRTTISEALHAVRTDNELTVPNEEHLVSTRVYALRAVELVGDLELLLGTDRYVQTVVASQRTVVLKLDVKHIDRLLAKRNPQALALLLDSIQKKLDCRLERNRHAQTVPLFRYALLRCYEMKDRGQKLNPVVNPANEVIRQRLAETRKLKNAGGVSEKPRDPLARGLERGRREVPAEYMHKKLGTLLCNFTNIGAKLRAASAMSSDEDSPKSNKNDKQPSKASKKMIELTDRIKATLHDQANEEKPAVDAKLMERRKKRRSRSAVLYSFFAPVDALNVVDLHSLQPDLKMLQRNNCYFNFRDKELFVYSIDK